MTKSISRNIGMISLCAVAVLLAQGAAQAGDLIPPTDAPQETMRTLDEIAGGTPIRAKDFNDGETPPTPVVYNITEPGYYYLVENVHQEENYDGIKINVGGVTLDLNGHTLEGTNDTKTGITVAGYVKGVTIRNGIVRNWNDGISTASTDKSVLLKELHVLGNGNNGMTLGGGCFVEQCIAIENGGDGFELMGSNSISRCRADENAGVGIQVNGSRNILDENIVFANAIGIEVNSEYHSLIIRNMAHGNTTANFVAPVIGGSMLSVGELFPGPPTANVINETYSAWANIEF